MRFLILILSMFSLSSYAAIDQCDYDYDDFIIFEGNQTQSYNVDNNYYDFKLGCSSRVAALYDGDDLIIYDGAKFKVQFVDDNYTHALLAIRKYTVAFYDGDDLFVYFNGKVNTAFVDDSYQDAGLFLLKDAGIFYDGDDLFYFCNGQIDKAFADDNQVPRRVRTPAGQRPSNTLAVNIGSDLFTLQTETCSLNRTSL